MTSQTKHYIVLGDLLGLRLQCKGCDSALSLPLENIGDAIPQKCPNCKNEWFNPNAQRTASAPVLAFVDVYRRLQEAFHSGKPVTAGFSLNLEVSGPTKPEPL